MREKVGTNYLTKRDQTTQVLNARDGEELLRVKSRGTAVFTPDGRYLATSGDAPARLWDISPSDITRAACARPARNLTRQEWQEFIGREPYRKTCPDLP